jgi:hypothetical protein
MNDPKQKLVALILNVGDLLCFASNEEGTKMFDELARFCRLAAIEMSARQRRAPLSLEGLLKEAEEQNELTKIPKKERPAKKPKSCSTHYCKSCEKEYQNEQVCDRCEANFRWCCAGYPREPCVDPFFPPSGVRVSLQSYCKDCLKEKSISAECIVAQEQEYLRILEYFSSDTCRWRWIPGFCDGFSVFSVTWVALEGLAFLQSPFYCQIGTEHDTLESRKDENFVEFVKNCADAALNLLANEMTEGYEEDVSTWTAVQIKPELASNLGLLDFHTAWLAVANTLNLECPTRIFVWKFIDNDKRLTCDIRYGPSEHQENEVVRTINVLMWNTEVATHFDLLIPKVTNFDQKQDLAEMSLFNDVACFD